MVDGGKGDEAMIQENCNSMDGITDCAKSTNSGKAQTFNNNRKKENNKDK
jgi:hypothetical protein